MRLTLRTLLAYLDDTLEPAQAKQIGLKIAESATARELIERIKQVTRRRRLTAPPVSGADSKLEANTVAEYLDNAIAPEQAEEIEAICLASDLHLAEVAACHQILTLLSGEPMSIPPSSKQRMQGLVAGPGAAHVRKPAVAAVPEKVPASGGPSPDAGAAQRLGMPPASQGGMANKLLIFGGGFVAALVLAFAILQVLNMGGTPTENKHVAATNEAKEVSDVEKKAAQDKKPAPTDTKKEEKKVEEKKEPEPKKEEKPEDKVTLPPDVVYAAADASTFKAIGQYQTDEAKDSNILLQESEDGQWKRLTTRSGEVISGKKLVSLPASWSSMLIGRGLGLTLCGSVPEITQLPVYECVVTPHHHDKLALDVTLHRGQFKMKNLLTAPQQVRVRFANPISPDREEFYDIILHPKAEMLVGLTSYYPPGEKFYADPKDVRRLGPEANVVCTVLSGFANVKFGDVTNGVEGPHEFQWNSTRGPGYGKKLPEYPAYALAEPPFAKADAKVIEFWSTAREAMKKARAVLAYNMTSKAVPVVLAESLRSADLNVARLAIRSMAALNDVSSLLEQLDPPQNDQIRRSAREALIDWIAYDRDNSYRLYEILTEKYKRVQAERILRLLHGLEPREYGLPETYDELIEYLDNSNPIIRELGATRLYQAVRAGGSINYSALADSALRQRAMTEWRRLIPPGQLPPSGDAPVPAGKGKS